MSEKRPYLICISGFDPSGGAGILADIKTAEMHRVQGLGVCSAITFQNERSFEGMEWVGEENLLKQLDVLLSLYQPGAVKIGIIESLRVLKKVIDRLTRSNPDISIVWDPILEASSGFHFHEELDAGLLKELLSYISLFTPNLVECQRLFGTVDGQTIAEKSSCPVLVKGGHSESDIATDTLLANGREYSFHHKKKYGFSKHGTGCILSSAIASNLAWDVPLSDACAKAKEYMQPILSSNNTQLAYHYEL